MLISRKPKAVTQNPRRCAHSGHKILAVAGLLVGLAAPAVSFAGPMDFSFTGTFSADDDVQFFNFTAGGASNVRLISYSFGGGTQADGNVVAAGGFDPILDLFDSTGALIGQNDDSGSISPGACGSGVVNPDAGREWDTCFNQVLAAGNYTVAIMQYNNFALGPDLAAGFTYAGQPNFTVGLGDCSNRQFCANDDSNRTNAWAFDILGVESAGTDIPVPSTLLLLGLGLLGIGSRRRQQV